MARKRCDCLLGCLLMLGGMLCGGCALVNQEQAHRQRGYSWPEVLQQAQQRVTIVNADAVLETIRAVEIESGTTAGFYYDFMFLLPSGEEISLSAKTPPDLDVQNEVGYQLQPPSPEELQLRRDIVQRIRISPAQALAIGAPLRAEAEKLAPLTLDVTPTLFLGTLIQKDYGVPVVWVLHIVNRQQDLLVAIDAMTGTIVREQKRAR